MTKAISLYFHVPFCTKKCPYCHFFVVRSTASHQDTYMTALYLEWQRVKRYMEGYQIVSIYFGGGTPSLLGAEKISRILSWVREARVPIAEDCEVTLEANPEHISYELMQNFKRAGINRVSIGIQSFSDPLLHQIGRTHSSGKGQEAILVTKEAGIDNITIDLMYDLPHQHLKDWEMTLERLSSLPITHLSLYNLVIEPDSAYHRKKKQLTAAMPHPEVSSKMLEVAIERFEALGLLRYEISAFAREGYRSQHNVGYWTGRPFLGLGPSAFSYFNGERFSNVANLTFYTQKLSQNQSAITFRERLPYPDDVHELLAVELRLIEGVDIPSFEKRHALLPPDTKKTIDRLISEGFLEREGARIRLSTKGLLFYDTVASEII